jgi:hypothetical protein
MAECDSLQTYDEKKQGTEYIKNNVGIKSIRSKSGEKTQPKPKPGYSSLFIAFDNTEKE